MFGMATIEVKIDDTVIAAIFIDMVNTFLWGETPTQMLLHHPTML